MRKIDLPTSYEVGGQRFRRRTSKSVEKTFIKSIDFWGILWYNILVRMREAERQTDQLIAIPNGGTANHSHPKNSGRDGGGTGTRGLAHGQECEVCGEPGNPVNPDK